MLIRLLLSNTFLINKVYNTKSIDYETNGFLKYVSLHKFKKFFTTNSFKIV
jgi:hypothetical protein